MAFPTANTRRTLSSALDRAQDQAANIKAIAQYNRDLMAAGAITASRMLALLDNLRGAKGVLSETSALAGIAAYAQGQLGDSSVSTEFSAMMTAIDNAGAWIISNFPKATDGALKSEDMDVQGNRTERTFSTTQTVALRTLLDTLIATIA